MHFWRKIAITRAAILTLFTVVSAVVVVVEVPYVF